MSKPAAYPLRREAEELMGKVNPTGTSHTLTLRVTESSGVLSMTISNPRLEIKNGDKVTWDVFLPATRLSSRVVIEFKGSRILDTFNGPTPGPARVSVPGDILGHDGTIKDSKERYSVTLVNGMTPVVLPYPSTASDPTPYLVIDDIGDPPGSPEPRNGKPGSRRWSHRRKS